MISPSVSVIVPCYNQANFLPESLKSIQNQNYPDWEAVVVDDGSTDNTAETAREFQAHDHRIRYLYQMNKGLAGARNTGIRSAQADIIALLDSDDLWEPGFLEIMLSKLKAHPQAAAVYCGIQFIDETGRQVGQPNVTISLPADFHKKLVNEGNWLAAHSVVFRKALASEVGLFDESLQALEDWDLWIRMSARHPFIGVPQALVKYRRHSTNMSSDPRRMITAEHQMTEKLFGPPDGQRSSWGEDKRLAYTRLYYSGALRYLANRDLKESACYLGELVELSPRSAQEMRFWRDLARAHIPMERRGDPTPVDWPQAEHDLLGLLEELDRQFRSSQRLQKNLRQVRGSAFIALARESVEHGLPIKALGWLRRAAAASPQLLFSRPYWGTVQRSLFQSTKRSR